MKHITTMIITISMLASLAMVSCNNNTQEPANTAVTTTPAVTTEAVSTTAEETDNFDDIISKYEKYDATSTSYDDVVKNAAKENIGKDFVVRFNDIPMCAVVFRSVEISTAGTYSIMPITAYAFGQTVDMSIDAMKVHNYEYGFAIAATSDIAYVGIYPSYYVITKNDIMLLDGSGDMNYRMYKYAEKDSCFYSISSNKYDIGQQALYLLTEAYTSDDDFVYEYGHIEITDKGISLVTEEKYNAGEWYNSDLFYDNYKKYRELPGCETFAGLVNLHKEYWDNEEYKENTEFEDWVKQKKG